MPYSRPSMRCSCPAALGVYILWCYLSAPSSGAPVTSIMMRNLGVCGNATWDYYNEVTQMFYGSWPPPCNKSPSYIKKPRTMSGPLAPYNEELTMVFGGPLKLFHLAVYYPQANGNWARTSYWNPTTSNNITWFNNMGGGASGVWDPCHGASQSYMSSDGESSASAPQQFKGILKNGREANVLSGESCGSDTTATGACGWTRGPSRKGFKGDALGQKLLMVEFMAPAAKYGSPYYRAGITKDTPAYWLLNARIVRTAQYGASCWAGSSGNNCGELDVAEVVPSPYGRPDRMQATAYSTTGASGEGNWFQRPNVTSKVFGVYFHVPPGSARGHATFIQIPSFSWGASLTQAQLDALVASAGTPVSFSLNSGITPAKITFTPGYVGKRTYVGCYQDAYGNRGMSDLLSKTVKSVAQCEELARASSKQYTYIGLENNAECWAGFSTPAVYAYKPLVAVDNCSYSCSGVSGSGTKVSYVNCGTRNALATYHLL